MEPVYREWDSVQQVEYIYRRRTISAVDSPLERVRVTPHRSRGRNFFRDVFLPIGYPHSVSADYATYQIWDTVQAFASNISGSLATQAVLEGVGVGDDSATALAATITWLLRHGTGMCGQIMFTWIQGSDLDHNCKKWRLFADIMNDSAILIELTAPLWATSCIQFVLCLASVARSLVGVSGSATRAAITQHQAQKNNISDVAAKDGSQETLVGLIALLLNLLILPLVGQEETLKWFLFFFMTCLHLFANYRAVTALQFQTFNQERFLRVITEYFRSQIVLDVPEGNQRESVLFGGQLSEFGLWGKRIHFGAPFSKLIALNLISKWKNSPTKEKENFSIISNEKDILVIFERNIETNSDVGHKAYFQACCLAQYGDDVPANIAFEDFKLQAQAKGWDFSVLQINSEGFFGKEKQQ
ncbi:hypothetical protein TCAL_11759 [Tigriopus californicus]|uniref:Protein root UVB sensitive/RUS domain-containing protein n=1 Tax=Tigriopus californicus TaxID=6832 RepID=A0A553NPS2_TIGCA|nr:RUS family member 1-like [Tigriopus californicus]TRY67425.1 hypothetical protein TCAL_11759 [Tigriopus californicus]